MPLGHGSAPYALLMRRWPLVLVLALAPNACSDDEVESVVIGEVPAAYRVTYRVEEGNRSSSERITVRRPFESRIETFDESDDASGEPTTTEINSFGRSARDTEGAPRLALAVPIGSASGDTRLDVVLEEALDAGSVARRDAKRVAGRACQVYRTGQSIGLVAMMPPTDDHVDVCVDAAGLVLEEVERADGAEVRRRVAIDVDVNPALDDDVFDVGERTLPIDRGGGAVRELTDDSRTPGRFFELGDDLPLPRTGRYAVVPPQPDAYSDPTLRGRRLAGLADILHRGVDVVVVERVGSLEGAAEVPAPAPHASPIRLGGLGNGDVELTAAGPVITVALGGGRYLRISGTLPTDEMAAVARGVREVDGGTLVPVGEEW